ncbi:hypothetical protein BZG36_05191 [Bifiguratus adelaidae]|uniref:Hexokinase n=1 Tax=Bifiguratus adelaidae TaxID=1938954 RepID=A0A261XTW8_9FUNG|nr:hypothetical protein BZG36_05191 [Bifiguratus adelaidae]
MARLGQKDKAEVELYVARELAYQQSLNTQHERHVALANAKKQEIEEANTRKHERQILGGRVFGEGYKGYGNARTESTSRIIYPQDRKRPRRTSEFRCLDLKKHAEKATSLAPIRLDLEVEGYKLRDTFTWDHYDTCVSAEHFADMLCEDLHLPRHMFKAPIIASIKEQIDDYGAHYPSAALESGDQRKPPSSTSSLASLGNEDLRILIKLDIVVGNWSLMDQFEWDVGDPNNDPEHFATILASELGLGGEFRTAIAHAIREQVFCYQKSLFLLGHPFDGTSVQDPDLKQSFRNPVEYIIREEKQIDMFTPVLIHLTDAEIEKMERDRERIELPRGRNCAENCEGLREDEDDRLAESLWNRSIAIGQSAGCIKAGRLKCSVAMPLGNTLEIVQFLTSSAQLIRMMMIFLLHYTRGLLRAWFSVTRAATPIGEVKGTDEQRKAVRELVKEFDVPLDTLNKISQHLLEEMEQGLASNDSAMPMLPSYLTEHPTGQETGVYYAIEVTGSVIRLFQVTLHGRGRITTRQQKHTIHEQLKKSDARHFYDYLAECVDGFLTFTGTHDPESPHEMGFSISFPIYQKSANSGNLLRWTKDFEIEGAEGKDVVELLQAALNRKKLPVRISALVNGVVGGLMAHNYRSLDTYLACTFSTGTNAAYWEKAESIEKMHGGPTDGEVIVNTEWGSFGDHNRSYLPMTQYDRTVNRESVHPNVSMFEKMVSGLYLGELLRVIILDLVDRRLLFNGAYSIDMNTPYNFETSYMSEIEIDASPDLEETKHMLETIMNVPETTLEDRQIVKRLCEMVGTRAARLCAAAMSAVINKRKMAEDGLTISVDGSIYEHYPNFPNRVQDALRELYGHKIDRINIGMTRDGGGIGAAIAAMMVVQKQNEPPRNNQIVQALRILLDAKTPQVSQWTRAHYRHALACVIQVELEVRANNAEEVQQQYQQAQQYLNKKYPTCVFATLDSLHDAQHEFCFTLMVNPNTPSAIYETLLCDWSLSNHADESAEEIFVRDFVQACRTAAESDILGDIVHTLYQAEKPRVIARPDSVQGLEAYLLDPDHQVELMLARDILKRCHAMPKDEAINMFHTCIVDTEDVNERLMLLAASNVLLECEEFPADFSCDARIQIKMLVESLEETVINTLLGKPPKLKEARKLLKLFGPRGPVIAKTVWDHYVKGPPLRSWDLKFHLTLATVRNILSRTSQTTVETVQTSSSRPVPLPEFVRSTPFVLDNTYRHEAAKVLGPLLNSWEAAIAWDWRKDAESDKVEPLEGEWLDVGQRQATAIESGECHLPESDTLLSSDSIVFYVHGGAYYIGSIMTHRTLVWRIAQESSARCFSFNYRLAPQKPFPAALQDTLAAYLSLIDPKDKRSKAIDPKKIVVMGDSAGGGLALAMLLALRNAKMSLPAGFVGLSPWIDLTHSMPSVYQNIDTDYLPKDGFYHAHSPALEYHRLPQLQQEKAKPREGQGAVSKGNKNSLGRIQFYAPNDALKCPYVSPWFDPMQLQGLPPMLIQAGMAERLRDESILAAYKASGQFKDQAATTSSALTPTFVKLELYKDMPHVFQLFMFPKQSVAAIRSIGAFVQQLTAPSRAETAQQGKQSVVDSGKATDIVTTSHGYPRLEAYEIDEHGNMSNLDSLLSKEQKEEYEKRMDSTLEDRVAEARQHGLELRV